MNYGVVGDRVVREDGYVAMQHYSTNPANVKVGDTIYVFVPKHNVSMAWINPNDVAKLEQVKVTGGG